MTAHNISFGHQRSAGFARAGFALRDDVARVQTLRQQGSAKAIALDGAEIVFLNTSGGLTGGDVLDYQLALGEGCNVTATTQTAERVYRSSAGHARMTVTLDVGAGGHLDWLPQETILFQRASAQRRTEITLAPGATCLTVETLVLGRAAMGETVTDLNFHDWRLIRRGNSPVHLEALQLDAARVRPSRAGLDDARAIASVVRVGPGAPDASLAVQQSLNDPDCRVAASVLEDRLVIRLMARDGWPLRRRLAQILTILRGKPPPRVWQI